MKKKALSLFLALLMMLAVVPVSVLPVFASEAAQNSTATEKNVVWDDMTAAEKTAAYASLYVKDASVILMAYDLADGKVALENGAGTWENLVDGNKVTLTAGLGAADNGYGTYSRFTFGHGAVLSPEADGKYFAEYRVGAITYDGDTPLYMAITEWYVASAHGQSSPSNGNCKPVKINDKLGFLSHQDYYTYKWVAEEGTTTYVKIQNYWEKASGGFKADGSQAYVLSDTAIDGATQRTRVVEWTTEAPADLTGWTVLEGGKFVQDALKDFFGGWQIGANGGIKNVLSDANLISRKGTVSIDLGATYLPALDSEYTIEIIASTNPAIDTDNNINTLGYNFNYQGELNRITAMQIGDRSQQWCVASTIYAVQTVFVDTNYNSISGNRVGPSSWNYKNNDINGKIATITYSKTADTAGYDYAFNYRFYNGSEMYNYGYTSHDNFTGEAQGTAFKLLQNVPNTTYAVRVYNDALSEEQKAQNHFVDLCAYFGVDISKLLNMDEATRATALSTLSAALSGKTFETASKDAIETAIVDVYAALGGSVDWNDMTAAQKTEAYKSLYVGGASVILMAYDLDGQVTLNADGSGSWKNLVDGNTVSLTKSAGAADGGYGTYSRINFGHGNGLPDYYEGYSVGAITYDGETPLYMAITKYYVAETNGTYATNSNTTCKPITINSDNRYLSHQDYYTYKWVAEEGTTTYVKIQNYWEKTLPVSFTSADNFANCYKLSDTAFDGAIQRTRVVEWTTEAPADLTGWTVLEGGKFVNDKLADIFGGWKAGANGGIQVTLTDANLVSNSGASSIKLDKSYIPAIDSEYTLEIIASTTPSVDTDNNGNTFGANFNWEGEVNRPTVVDMSTRLHQWGIGSDLLTNASAFMTANYNFVYSPNGNNQKNINAKLAPDANGKIATITYSKTADTVGYDYDFSYRYYNGSKMTEYAYKSHDNYEGGEKYQTNNFILMQYVSNTTYSVRLYNTALSAEQKNQNHFVDLCAYFGVDVSKLLDMDETTRATALSTLSATFADKTFETASKDAIETAILDVYVALSGPLTWNDMTAAQKTAAYASLYAPGATAILLAYNAKNDGTITLNNGAGTWKNLVNGELYTLNGSVKTFTGKDGKEYSTGWTLSDKSVGYNVSIEQVKAGTNHYIELPGSLMGDAYTSTTEIVSARQPLQIDTTSTATVGSAYSNVSYLLNGRNFAMRYQYKVTIAEGTTAVPSDESQNDYNSKGRWDGTRALWPIRGLNSFDGQVDRVILMDTPKDDEKMQARIYLYTDGKTAAKSSQEETATAAGKEIPYIPTGGAATMELFKNVPADVYAIRTYTRNLNSDEIALNHFVDLCAYLQVDISKLLDQDDAKRATILATLAATFADKTFATASKDEIETAINDLCPDPEEEGGLSPEEALAKTKKYASLYAPGATAILLAYNAKNDGTITLSNGAGTWVNLVTGEAYTLTGTVKTYQVTETDGSKTDYTTGWTLGDKSVGYNVSIQEVKAGTNHYITLPSSLMGDAYTSTMEIVSARQPMEFDNSGRPVKEWNGEYEQWVDLVNGKNFNVHYKYKDVKADGMTQVPSGEIQTDYNANGKWDGTRAAWPIYNAYKYDSQVDRIILMDKPKDDGKMQLRLYLYTDGNTLAESKQEETNANAPSVPTGGAATMNLFVNVPADVYAIRTYARNLNEIEMKQNHFADLCAYYELDIDELGLVGTEGMESLYEAFASFTFNNTSASELQAILDATISEQVHNPIRFQGVAGRLEDYAAIRGTFTFSVIEQTMLAANGLKVVDFGAMVAIADGISMSDLTVTYDGTATTADADVIALASNLAGMSYNYVLDGVGVVYTLSVTYGNLSGDALKAAYETDLIYRGYIVVENEKGEIFTLYTDGVTETFGESASMKDVADKLVENEAYADNEILNGIIDACAQ